MSKMVDGKTEDIKTKNECMICEAMDTGKMGDGILSGEKRICISQLIDELKTEQLKMPVEEFREIRMKVDEIQANKNLQVVNKNEKKVNEPVKNASDRFDLNIQFKQNLIMNYCYEEQRSMIEGQVTWIYQNYLYIDHRHCKTKPDFIDTAVSAVDRYARVRHHWRRTANLWEGAVAVFKTARRAWKAQRKLSYSKNLKVVSMRGMFKLLIEAEVRYPNSSESATILIIRGKTPLLQWLKRWIVAELREFGQVLFIEFRPHTNPDELCRVWYRYASHAILAKLIWEQSDFTCVGKVSADIVMTRKENRIMGFIKDYLRQK